MLGEVTGSGCCLASVLYEYVCMQLAEILAAPFLWHPWPRARARKAAEETKSKFCNQHE